MTSSDAERLLRGRKAPRPEPIRRIGPPFFDDLIAPNSSRTVRRALYRLVAEQYQEADRISGLRGWGGAQPHGNDRYQYSLEQKKKLFEVVPAAEWLRPKRSLLYRIGGALIYPIRFGVLADDCPVRATFDGISNIQAALASGESPYDEPTLFDPDPFEPPTVVWLLFSGNHVESGPLASYVGLPDGMLVNGRIEWKALEPLVTDDESEDPGGPQAAVAPRPGPIDPTLPALLTPEPELNLTIRT